MKRIVFGLLLLMSLSRSIPAQGPLLTREEIASLIGSGKFFTREEVIELVAEITEIADAEIKRTAEEAVKAAALQAEPERAKDLSLAESWRKEAEKAEERARLFKGFAAAEAVVIGVLGLVIGVREATR